MHPADTTPGNTCTYASGDVCVDTALSWPHIVHETGRAQEIKMPPKKRGMKKEEDALCEALRRRSRRRNLHPQTGQITASSNWPWHEAGGDGEVQVGPRRYPLFEDHGGAAVGAGGHAGALVDGGLRHRLSEPQGHGGLKEPEERTPGSVVQAEVADLAEL